MKNILPTLVIFALAACQQTPQEDVTEIAAAPDWRSNLTEVLAAQPEEVRARYQYRHPQETLEFIGIEPGMTVLEGLPGRGWYTKLLCNTWAKTDAWSPRIMRWICGSTSHLVPKSSLLCARLGRLSF